MSSLDSLLDDAINELDLATTPMASGSSSSTFAFPTSSLSQQQPPSTTEPTLTSSSNNSHAVSDTSSISTTSNSSSALGDTSSLPLAASASPLKPSTNASNLDIVTTAATTIHNASAPPPYSHLSSQSLTETTSSTTAVSSSSASSSFSSSSSTPSSSSSNSLTSSEEAIMSDFQSFLTSLGNSGMSTDLQSQLTDPTKKKELAKSLVALTGNLPAMSAGGMGGADDPEFNRMMVQMMKGMMNAENAPKNPTASASAASTPSGSSSSSSSASAASATPPQASNPLEAAFSMMSSNSAASSSSGPAAGAGLDPSMDAMLSQLLSDFDTMQGPSSSASSSSSSSSSAAPNNLSAFNQAMEQFLSQMLSKDVLYAPLKDLQEKFPVWLREHRSSLSSADVDRYEKQIDIIHRIVTNLDASSEVSSTVINLMNEMQQYGQPPAELVPQPPPGSGDGLPGMPNFPGMGMGGGGGGAGDLEGMDEEKMKEMLKGFDPNKCPTM